MYFSTKVTNVSCLSHLADISALHDQELGQPAVVVGETHSQHFVQRVGNPRVVVASSTVCCVVVLSSAVGCVVVLSCTVCCIAVLSSAVCCIAVLSCSIIVLSTQPTIRDVDIGPPATAQGGSALQILQCTIRLPLVQTGR